MAFLFILGQALPAHLVGGCGARAVSRKTPIYFIVIITIINIIFEILKDQILLYTIKASV